MNRLQTLRNQLEQKKGQRSQIESLIEELKQGIRENRKKFKLNERAREVVKEVGLKTQQQLQFHIGDITSLAMEAVFHDPYKLIVEFVVRRNKTECDLLFERDGNLLDPEDSSGGGTVDVAAFALRIASYSMEYPRSNNVMILDEPMRFLSVDCQEQASLMIKEISEKLGLQFIIITHEPTLAIHADRQFNTSIRNGISVVK